MKNKICCLFITLALLAGINQSAAQGTAFTYQGQLQDNGSPASGTYNLAFTLFTNNTGGVAVAGPVSTNGITVANGLFTVLIDFGPGSFTGQSAWLEINVETNGASSFTTLSPRQQLTPTPYAIYASNAAVALRATTATTATSSGSATTAVSFSGSLSGDVTGPQSATVVSSLAGQTAANIAAGLGAANAATSSNTAGTIVKRDGSGSFSSATITLAGNLNLPATTTSAGIIYSGGIPMLQARGQYNSFVGLNAGNLTMSGSHNTANGSEALYRNTSGSNNTANGYGALWSNTSGNYNTTSGYQALSTNTTGTGNTANGAYALFVNTSGSDNTADGYQALQQMSGGSGNIALGFQAGFSLATGNNNIDIGNQGVAGEGNTIRIGNTNVQINTYIAGVYGGALGSFAVPVYVNAVGQLGTAASSRRYKDNIQSMGNASDVLYALQPVTFRYKPELDPECIPQFGLVAEDVDKVDPDLVVRDQQHGIYTVRYEAVNVLLLNEFLKEHSRVEQQAGELAKQNKEMQELKSRLEKLEQLLNARTGGGQ
jgi:hypothetical protein